MKSFLRILIFCLTVGGVAGGLIWGFLTGRTEQAAEAKREAPVEAPSRVTTENGATVLAFDTAAQKANGIVVTQLASVRRRVETQANGVVLQLQPLLDLKTSYNSAQMDIAKARAVAQASQAEYERLQRLNHGDENVAVKTVESAHATAESDTATLQNAEQSLVIIKNSIELRWGATVARWLEQGSPQVDALLAQREYLLQVTSSNPGSGAAPQEALVQYAGGTRGVAHLISILPQLDPRLQMPSWLYIVAARPGLVPGINLPVFLPSGPTRNGIMVPSSAVVWWQGKAWCYVEESSGKFERRAISTSSPMADGWFVSEALIPAGTEGISAGDRVVIAGAQTLISEEFRSQIDTDED
ncbi:MAG: hypothetical protein KGM96_15935 [Acidobacteriota bacterium]|nr:hypothetical protein [Acidobacteriota bacterium]